MLKKLKSWWFNKPKINANKMAKKVSILLFRVTGCVFTTPLPAAPQIIDARPHPTHPLELVSKKEGFGRLIEPNNDNWEVLMSNRLKTFASRSCQKKVSPTWKRRSTSGIRFLSTRKRIT